LIRYALGWLGLGTLTAVVLIAALGGGDHGADDVVSLPPVRETELGRAARDAGCEFRRAAGGERLNPPVDGAPGGASARPGIYDESPRLASLTSAARRGIVVIQYRPGLAEDDVDALATIQRALPAGTIVTPNATAMPYELAVTGYRRLLACAHYSDDAVEATRLFQGRYLGRGPESTG
jgi:hypothetical protein